jgi:hypothetical protein
MGSFNLLTEDAQVVVILGAALILVGTLIGFIFKAWLDRSEHGRRREQEQEEEQRTRGLVPRPEIRLQKKADHRPHDTSNGITMDGTLC